MGIGIQLEEIISQDYIITQGWPLEVLWKTYGRLLWWFSGYDSVLPLLGAGVRTLLGKLRSHMPYSMPKKKIFFFKRRGYEGRETSWKAIKIVPLSPRCLQKKPCFFLGSVTEEGVTAVLNPRHLVHPTIHSCSLCLRMPPMCHATCKILKI